jgi:hypothetical protein
VTTSELAERLTVTIPEAAEILGVDPDAAYRAVKRGEFPVPTIRVGRRIVVPAAPLRAVLGIDSPEAPGSALAGLEALPR